MLYSVGQHNEEQLMSVFMLNYKRITNGSNIWNIDGYVNNGEVILVRVYGDITDEAGIEDAVKAMLQKKRYRRAGIKLAA